MSYTVSYDIGGGKEIIAKYDENGFMETTREVLESLIEKQIPFKPIKAENIYIPTINTNANVVASSVQFTKIVAVSLA